MSFWSHNPELLDEVTKQCLPEPWKSRVEDDEIDLLDVPSDILYAAMNEGTRDYFAGLADAERMRRK